MYPFFSVVIPTYNCADLLKIAIDSVLNQSARDFEIIVIDNNSVDNTQEVLKCYSDERLKVFSINNNGIIASSRNKGIQKSKGKWISFLDSDDYWVEDKLKKVKECIQVNPNYILVCHNENQVINGVVDKPLYYGPASSNMYEKLLFQGNCLSTSAVCVKRKVALKTNGFSEDNRFITAEDYEYWLRLSNEGEFGFINEVLGFWCTHGNNLSSNIIFHTTAYLKVVDHHLDLWLDKFPQIIDKRNKGLSTAKAKASNMLRLESIFPEAKRHIIDSIKLNPFNFKAWVIYFLIILKIRF